MTYDLHKAAAVLIKDRKLLLTHEKGKDFYISPGGKLEENETPLDCLVRELHEEINIKCDKNNFEFLATFFAPAAGQEHKVLRMDVYTLKLWKGTPIPNNIDEEIDDIAWVNSTQRPKGIQIGSIFEHEVIPLLKKENLID